MALQWRRRRSLTVLAVCSAQVRPILVAGQVERSGIDKRPSAEAVRVGPLGLEGDEQAEARFHGGVDRAVYAYADEDARWWEGVLGRGLTAGAFGENLRTVGADISGARVGDRFRSRDGVLLEVSAPRIPCAKLAAHLGVPDMVSRFLSAGRPGAYLRVLAGGAIGAGDVLEHVRSGDGPTVREVMAQRRGSPTRDELGRLADCDALAEDLRRWAREALELR